MRTVLLFVLLFLSFSPTLYAQHHSDIPNLYKRMSLEISGEPLGNVLDLISKKGGFFFSYSGAEFNRDSLISLSAHNMTVRDILDRIFAGTADYRESSRHIILRSTLLRFTIVPEIIKTSPKYYLITGNVKDVNTGKAVSNASVYEKRLLASTLTDRNGSFRMRLRGDFQSVVLTASKEAYRDTSMMFLSTVTIKPEGYKYEDEDLYYASNIVERLGISRFLVSAKQRIQSLNISGFLAKSPFQASIIPGVSSQGMFSSQVVNKASLNMFGGYTAGVNGAELAGIFNLNKGDVQYVQFAGLANIVGGSVRGFQGSGLINSVLDSVKGVQVSGLVNDVRKNVNGWQMAGLVNRSRNSLDGAQAAGLFNLVSENVEGVQFAGLGNMSKEVRGMQLAGLANIARHELEGTQFSLFNYARKMQGTQIGLINFADTSSGLSIGLINWINNGYRKISLSANEIFNYQAGIKTGNAKLYTTLIAAATFKEGGKVYSAGLGFGHDFIFNDRLSTAAELSFQGLYLGNWGPANVLSRAQLNFQLRLSKEISFFAGPSYSLYYTDPADLPGPGFAKRIGPKNAHRYNSFMRGWLGWSAGVNLF